MTKVSSVIVQTPIGRILIRATSAALIAVEFVDNVGATLAVVLSENNDELELSPFFKKALRQFTLYFRDPSYQFTLPVLLNGTSFQQSVWRVLQNIPPGQTRTYGELACQLQTSPRAVGNACRANPIPIIIPCHRVISKQGLGGFAGKTSGKLINVKRWLLCHEGLGSAVDFH